MAPGLLPSPWFISIKTTLVFHKVVLACHVMFTLCLYFPLIVMFSSGVTNPWRPGRQGTRCARPSSDAGLARAAKLQLARPKQRQLPPGPVHGLPSFSWHVLQHRQLPLIYTCHVNFEPSARAVPAPYGRSTSQGLGPHSWMRTEMAHDDRGWG